MTRKLIDREEAVEAIEDAATDTVECARSVASIRALPAIEPDYEAAAAAMFAWVSCFNNALGEPIYDYDSARKMSLEVVDAALGKCDAGPGPSTKPTCETCGGRKVIGPGRVLNPEAIGNPDLNPVVQFDPCPDCAGGER